MHPEITINNDEVIATLGMAHSVIQSMVADMESRQADPLEEIVNVLPTIAQLKLEDERNSEDEEDIEGARQLRLGGGDNSARSDS
jgi:hypothetical protein